MRKEVPWLLWNFLSSSWCGNIRILQHTLETFANYVNKFLAILTTLSPPQIIYVVCERHLREFVQFGVSQGTVWGRGAVKISKKLIALCANVSKVCLCDIEEEGGGRALGGEWAENSKRRIANTHEKLKLKRLLACRKFALARFRKYFYGAFWELRWIFSKFKVEMVILNWNWNKIWLFNQIICYAARVKLVTLYLITFKSNESNSIKKPRNCIFNQLTKWPNCFQKVRLHTRLGTKSLICSDRDCWAQLMGNSWWTTRCLDRSSCRSCAETENCLGKENPTATNRSAASYLS